MKEAKNLRLFVVYMSAEDFGGGDFATTEDDEIIDGVWTEHPQGLPQSIPPVESVPTKEGESEEVVDGVRTEHPQGLPQSIPPVESVPTKEGKSEEVVDGVWTEAPPTPPTRPPTTETPKEQREKIEERIEEFENRLKVGDLTPGEQMEYMKLKEQLIDINQKAQEAIEKQERKKKNLKRWAIVAGVFLGGPNVIAGAIIGVGIGKLAVGLASKGNKLTEKLQSKENSEEKERIKKRTDKLGNHLKIGEGTSDEQMEYMKLKEQLMDINQKAQEAIEKQERKEKNLKRWAIVAGVFLGGTGVIAGAIIGVGIGKLATGLTRWRGNKLTEKLQSEENSEEREKIKKKIEIWNKIKVISQDTAKIAEGTLNLVFKGDRRLVNTLNAGEQGISGVGAPEQRKRGHNNSNGPRPKGTSDGTTLERRNKKLNSNNNKKNNLIN